MEKIVVKVEVDEKQAILAGQTKHGLLEVTDPISSLNEEQRKELLTCMYNSGLYLVKNNNVRINNYHASQVLDADIYKNMIYYPSSASIEELKKALDARIILRTALEEKIKAIVEQEEIDKKLLRDVDLEIGKNPERYIVDTSEYSRDVSEEIKVLEKEYGWEVRECMTNLEKLREDIESYNKTKQDEKVRKDKLYKVEQYETFLGCYSPDKLERYRANCLPNDELNEVIKCVVFDAFEESKILESYIKLNEDDIPIGEDCNHEGCMSYRADWVAIIDLENIIVNGRWGRVELSSASFDALKYIVDATKDMQKNNMNICEKVEIRIMQHTASCSFCDNYAAKYGAKVYISWNDETYSKEYDIFDEPK